MIFFFFFFEEVDLLLWNRKERNSLKKKKWDASCNWLKSNNYEKKQFLLKIWKSINYHWRWSINVFTTTPSPFEKGGKITFLLISWSRRLPPIDFLFGISTNDIVFRNPRFCISPLIFYPKNWLFLPKKLTLSLFSWCKFGLAWIITVYFLSHNNGCARNSPPCSYVDQMDER